MRSEGQKDKIMNLYKLFQQVELGKISASEAYMKHLSLLDENEVGVSDSSEKHGDLPHVRERNASGETDKSSDEFEQITLGKRIDDENEGFHKCPYCGFKSYLINYHYAHMDNCEYRKKSS